MKCYMFSNCNTPFARCTFKRIPNREKKRCMSCMIPYDRTIPNVIPPYKIEFIPSTTEIGDCIFSTGEPYPIVSKSLRDFILSQCNEMKFDRIEIIENENTLVPNPPYQDFYLLTTPIVANIDLSKTKFDNTSKCTECHRQEYSLKSIKDNYIFIQKTNENLNIFRLSPFEDGATYITESMLELIISKGFKNLQDFPILGEIVI